MDRKIHIHFCPRDASRIRVISFSHALGAFLLFTLLPLCLIGFWLALSGVLREKPGRRLERQRLQVENRVLGEKTAALATETDRLRQNLDSLEAVRIRALSATGLEALESHKKEKTSDRFSFFGFVTKNSSPVKNLQTDLDQARQASIFFDSSLFVLSQNRALAACLPTSWPMAPEALVIRPFGPSTDPFTGRRSLHAGVDFSLRLGANVYAAGGGRVLEAGQDPLWGNYVRIRHTDRLESFYAHLQAVRVQPGEAVDRGQVIGKLGQSGEATGPHLHFEISFDDEKVDPMPYLLPQESREGAISRR